MGFEARVSPSPAFDILADAGIGEWFKTVMHGLVIATCAPVLAYNGWALTRRRAAHLVVNVVLFSAVVALEVFWNLPQHLRGKGA